MKKGFKKQGNTNALYHPRIPRTLQLATRRPNQRYLRFVKNMVLKITPQANEQHVNFCCRANSIGDIMVKNGSQMTANSIVAQGSDYQPVWPSTEGQPVTDCESFDKWKDRFQHFTILGSKVSLTYEPIGTNAGEPTTLYLGVGGIESQIQNVTDMNSISKLPYYKRAQILGSATQGFGQGKRLYQFYSSKKFEGVRDVIDNQQLRGRFPNQVTGDLLNQPGEQSFFYWGIINTVPNAAVAPCAGIMRARVEYIVHLSEPTNSNITTNNVML
jgi:hypothetical protein